SYNIGGVRRESSALAGTQSHGYPLGLKSLRFTPFTLERSSPMRLLNTILAAAALASFAGCTSSMDKAKLTQLLEENPEILTNAIEKNPAAIAKALQNAQRAAQQEMARSQQEQMAKEQEKYFTDPLKPTLGNAQVFVGPKDAKVTIV